MTFYVHNCIFSKQKQFLLKMYVLYAFSLLMQFSFGCMYFLKFTSFSCLLGEIDAFFNSHHQCHRQKVSLNKSLSLSWWCCGTCKVVFWAKSLERVYVLFMSGKKWKLQTVGFQTCFVVLCSGFRTICRINQHLLLLWWQHFFKPPLCSWWLLGQT